MPERRPKKRQVQDVKISLKRQVVCVFDLDNDIFVCIFVVFELHFFLNLKKFWILI